MFNIFILKEKKSRNILSLAILKVPILHEKNPKLQYVCRKLSKVETMFCPTFIPARDCYASFCSSELEMS